MLRTIAVSLLALGLTLGCAVAQRLRQSEPGNFDYYLLSLSWSPQFERGFPEACQVPPPRLDRRIVDSMLDLMPAPALVFHEWDAHGTCSGLPPRDYFDTVRKARAAVTIPPQFVDPPAPQTVTPREVVDAFVKANDGLNSAGIQIDCDRTRLREVRICMTRDLAFRDCSGRPAVCRSPTVVMPPARGQ
jgi:ribonuclease T2